MNLLEMVSYTRSLLGDVGEDDLIENEIIANLNHGQNRVVNALINAEREKFVDVVTITSVAGQSNYVLPYNVNDVIQVSVGGREATPLAVTIRSAPDRLSTYRPNDRTKFYTEILAESGRSQLIITPAPEDTSSPIVIYYVKRATPFSQDYGIVDLATVTLTADGVGHAIPSTTRFVASGVPFAATASKRGVDGFWNSAEIRWKTGNNKGIVSRVQTFYDRYDLDVDAVYDYGVFQLRADDALPNAPSSGGAPPPPAADTFELTQVSILPIQHHEMVVMWAAALCAPKANRDPNQFMVIFDSALKAITGKYIDNVERPLAGTSGTGVK